MKRKASTTNGKPMRGFARIHLKDLDGNILEERTMENQFTDLWRNQILYTMSIGGSCASSVAAIAIGTGGVITGSSTSLPGELNSGSDTAGANVAADNTVSSS